MGELREIMLGAAARGAARGAARRTLVARAPQKNSVRLMSEEANAYTALRNKEAFFGTAHEQPAGSYDNTIHEQDELWWDDGTARREPIFDSDFIPLSEAIPMFLGGFALFAAVAATHKYILDPAASRPTVPRDMPEAHIWESYGSAPAAAADDEDEDEDE